MADELRYMPGFGNEFESEALPGALPHGQNSPQRCAYGLYAEQLSGSAFTAARGANRRSWLYRIRPSVLHARRFAKTDQPLWRTAPDGAEVSLGQFRWGPVPVPQNDVSFVSGLRTMTTAGSGDLRLGMAAHVFFVTQPMTDEYFCDADGELLIVPQQGGLELFTEFGRIAVAPGDICVIPRGVTFQAKLADGPARGFVCENYGAPFALPQRGAIGANCLANARDFKTPIACFEDRETPSSLTTKWGGRFFTSEIRHSPLDVVAWHGNYAPYKYCLRDFCPVGAILYDHPDPSIFTVLTSPSDEAGVGNVDFAIFSERWLVAEHTFRPPWYHRNVMSEFMGLIEGQYDAKPQGFAPGGMSLHNMMSPHGPDATAFARASKSELQPERLSQTLTFMFETRLTQHLTLYAASLPTLEKDYADCWSDLPKLFDGSPQSQGP
ncbi:MAG TPA: homogentisate 1,2-dioxygenase [Methylocystis sp.]|nr:homogentisate 1,2-dioxygenase [Methylocystis sp.]